MTLNDFGIKKLSILSTLILFITWFAVHDIEIDTFIDHIFTTSLGVSIALLLTIIYFIFKSIFYVVVERNFIVVRIYIANILGSLIFSTSLSFCLFYFSAMSLSGDDRMEGYAVFMLSFMLMVVLLIVSSIYFIKLRRQPNFNIIKNLKNQLFFVFFASLFVFILNILDSTINEAFVAFLYSFLILLLPTASASLIWYFIVRPSLNST